MPRPALHTLVIADDIDGWERAGFVVDRTAVGRGEAWVGSIRLEMVGRPRADAEPGSLQRGIVAWEFDEIDEIDDGGIDGIPTARHSAEPARAAPPEAAIPPTRRSDPPRAVHPNGASRLDHVVMMSPDLDRTVGALERHGFEARRTRAIPGSDPPRQQVFFWAGETIIELVAPVTPTGDDPARLWGLAITSDDIDQAAARLGEHLGRPKPAVQAGRRIATVRTAELDISTAIALMTPHTADDRRA